MKSTSPAPATVKRKRRSKKQGWLVWWFSQLWILRTKPFEDEDYVWRDWFGGREGKRRARGNKFFILHDRKYYKHFILEGKYE